MFYIFEISMIPSFENDITFENRTTSSKVRTFSYYSLYVKIALKWPNLVRFSKIFWFQIVWLNFFARNGFGTIRNGGTDTKILKIGPNFADLGHFFIFSSATLLYKVHAFLRKIKRFPKNGQIWRNSEKVIFGFFTYKKLLGSKFA